MSLSAKVFLIQGSLPFALPCRAFFFLLVMFFALPVMPPAMAQQVVTAQFSWADPSTGDHNLAWATRTGYYYHVLASPDLQTWVDTGILEPGGNNTVIHSFEKTGPRMFYRVIETGFLSLPTPMQQVDRAKGISFAFDLELLAQIPAKIRLYNGPGIPEPPGRRLERSQTSPFGAASAASAAAPCGCPRPRGTTNSKRRL